MFLSVPGQGAVGGAMAAQAALVTGTTLYARVVVGGAKSWRVRWLSTGGGTLSAAYLRPGQPLDTPLASLACYSANNPSDVTVTADAETKIEDTAPDGCSEVRLKFVAGTLSGTKRLTYCDLLTTPAGA